MSVQLNDYNYSRANDIGNAFQKPCYSILSNVLIAAVPGPEGDEVLRVAKLALHVLAACVLIIPLGLIALAGRTICYFSATRIDYGALSLAPPPIQVHLDQDAYNQIDIRVLSQKYNQLNLPVERVEPGRTPTRVCFERMCNNIANQHHTIYQDDAVKRGLFCKEVSLLLKGIIHKIQSGEVSKDKEKDLLLELAKASSVCYPTWLEVAAKLYREVHGRADPVQEKLLRWVQEYKESLITEFCQLELDDEHWHKLNYVRTILGRELGLDTVLNTLDANAPQYEESFFTKSLIKSVFLIKFDNANRCITAILARLNSEAYDQSYYDFLVNSVVARTSHNPAVFVQNHFYTKDYKINEAGVTCLLKSIGVLK